MASLAEIKARLAQEEAARNGNFANRSNGPSPIYPHWNIPVNKEVVVRFLSDKNPNNTFFWRERAMINLPFQGIIGDPASKEVIVKVPCVDMYNDGSVCPIQATIKPWYKPKDPELEKLANTYWKKRTYLFQGFVVVDPIGEAEKPENPIRRFIISPQIMPILKKGIDDLDENLDKSPDDLYEGLDFRITKTAKGTYFDYTTSTWSRRPRALTDEEMQAIDTYGLSDLGDFLPKKPDEQGMKVLQEMFEASLEHQPYDPARWGEYFRPSGMRSEEVSFEDGEQSASTRTYSMPSYATASPAPAQTEPAYTSPVIAQAEEAFSVSTPESFEAQASTPNESKANDILNRIRSRAAQ